MALIKYVGYSSIIFKLENKDILLKQDSVFYVEDSKKDLILKNENFEEYKEEVKINIIDDKKETKKIIRRTK